MNSPTSLQLPSASEKTPASVTLEDVDVLLQQGMAPHMKLLLGGLTDAALAT